MPLVDYPSSDSNPEDNGHTKQTPPKPFSKRRKLSSDSTRKHPNEELPPLPPSFRDVYSSTIRTSTQDDPSLHGGRKRVTPHIQGNWPAHVYLDWQPSAEETDRLSVLLEQVQTSQSGKDATASTSGVSAGEAKGGFHSLLRSELGVPLPLHVSLSRPLTLKTENKDDYLDALKQVVKESGVRVFTLAPNGLSWHPNEIGTRWFLVLKLLHLDDGNQLVQLLRASNKVAARFWQPQLYATHTSDEHYGSTDQNAYQTSPATGKGDDVASTQREEGDQFHVSLAWALTAPEQRPTLDGSGFMEDVKYLRIYFEEVKVRIGQDVHTIPLRPRRQNQRSVGLT